MQSAATPAPVRLTVETSGGTCRVDIATGLASRVRALLDAAVLPRRRFVVSSPTIWRFHSERFAGLTPEEPILIPDGERFKTSATVGRIYDALIKAHADRASVVVAIGGGVVGDVAGFAAATYMRGLPLVQVPTTLLAQVDSSVGGKVGVNHPLGKNLIGAFHQPATVIVDPELLTTLPRREFRAGLYEVVKYGMIASRSLFERVEQDLAAIFNRDAVALVPVIAESCRIKADVVHADERESGPRRVLNFGHTAAHALEAITKYRRFRHGEAVAYGMMVAAEIGVSRGTLTAGERDLLAALIMKLGPLPPVADLDAAVAVEAVARDKKVVDGTLHYVLPRGIGSSEIVTDVTMTELSRALHVVGLRS